MTRQAAIPRLFSLLVLLPVGAAAEVTAAAPASQDLDPLVVTGTRGERRLSEVPVRTEVIDRTEIEKTQSRTLADAIEWTPGVRVENDCQNCNFQQIRLLGLQGNFTQILADGRPLLSSLASVYGIEHLPTALVDRIEIVKGGASALYGPGAIAGVINVIPRIFTENGGYLKYGYESMGGGPNHFFEGGLDLVNSAATAGITLFGQSSETQAVDINKDGFSDVSMREGWSGGLRGFWKPASDQKLTFDYLTSHEKRRGGDVLHLPVTQALIAEAIDSELHSGGLRWEHEVSERFDYEVNLSGTYTKRDTYYGSTFDPNAFGNSESPLLYFDLTGRFAITDKLKATTALQYQREKLEDQQPAYDRFTDQEVRNAGVLGQLEWDISEKFNLVGGARVDDNSLLDAVVVSPRLAVKYQAMDDLAIRSGYSSGFRAPQVFDEDLHITQAGGVSQVIRNASDLVEETSESLTFGMEWKPSFISAAARQPVSIEGNLFFTRLRDTFDLIEDDNLLTPEQEFSRINAGAAKVYGIELNLNWQLSDDLRLDLGFVEQRSRFDDPSGDFDSRDFERTPERYGVLGLTWDSPWCEVFLGAKYTGPMEVPHYAGFVAEDRLEQSPSFLTWDVGLARTFDLGDMQMRISAGVKNILNSYQDDLDQGPDRDSAYVYGPRFPRQFQISCQIDF